MHLRQVTLNDALRHAGIDISAALPAARNPVPRYHWVVTPVSRCDERLESSKLYRSIKNEVNDKSKQENFSVMLNALFQSADLQDYQGVIKGSSVSVKVAYDFSYLDAKHRLWELKHGNKDRIYFFSMTIPHEGRSQNLIVLLQALHKKDQKTPTDVTKYAERTMKACLNPREQVSICRSPT